MDQIQKLEKRISDLEEQIPGLQKWASDMYKWSSQMDEWVSHIDERVSLALEGILRIYKWKKAIVGKQDAASLDSIADQLEEIADLKREEHDARFKREHNL